MLWHLLLASCAVTLFVHALRAARNALPVLIPAGALSFTWWQAAQTVTALCCTLLLGVHRRRAAAAAHAAKCSWSCDGHSTPIASAHKSSGVIVIGAGPSGLVAAKYLLERGHHVTVLEAESNIGGTFRYRAYEHAIQVSSKYLTTFCDLRLPSAADEHLTLPAYLDYLDEYARKFRLREVIRFGSYVHNVQRRSPDERAAGAPEYAVTVSYSRHEGRNEVIEASAVIVCTGLHLSPLIPRVPGLENFGGEVIHSVDYKSRAQIEGKNLLIVGSGETGMDICYHAVCQPGGAQSVSMSTKSGFLSIPSCLPNGLPLDICISNIFECCYEHRWVERCHLKWRASTFGIRAALWLFSGSSTGYNQWSASKNWWDVQRGWHFINKSARAMAALNAPIKSRWSNFPHNLAQSHVATPATTVVRQA